MIRLKYFIKKSKKSYFACDLMGAGKGEMDVVSAQKSRNVKAFPAEIKIFVQLAFKVCRHAVKVNAPDTGFGLFECVNPFGNELIILYGCDKTFAVFF